MWILIFSIVVVLCIFILFRFHEGVKLIPKQNQVVFITGCDSGLGYFCAMESHKKGFTVVATVLNVNSEGAKLLKEESEQSTKKIHVVEMNLLNEETIVQAHEYLSNLLKTAELTLHAVVNNAGVMCFGEFEWFVKDMIMEQLQVNMIGPMLVVKKFLPLIRQHKSRIVNVVSHCSFNALPGLSVYSASKAGLKLWSDAIQNELNKFGVSVINFIPGSFFQSSNIATRTVAYIEKMKQEMAEEQLDVYEEYFDRYYDYVRRAFNFKSPAKVSVDMQIIDCFMNTLIDSEPKSTYKMEPWKYKFYYTAISIVPGGTKIDRWLTDRFMTMPKYKK